MLEIGSVVDNKYKILAKIGQGGMSIVYLAMNERANKQWAIKEIRKDTVADMQVVKQSLIVETDMLKSLSHPNLPSIVDIIDYDDTFLIVMDYIEGNTLSKAITEYGPQSQEYVIEWAKQMCDVLGYLHSQNPPIIYRDLKPGNIMLKPDGKIVLIDFGTARQYKETNKEDTTCLGTRGYAAPEQFGGHGQTDARTDIYCLGTTMYHLVTGKNPSEPPYEIYPIRHWNEGLSQGLEQIISKCTQLNPANRYQNCQELLYDLEHYYELDANYKKKERTKLISFGVMAGLTILAAVGAIYCHIHSQSIKTSNYDTYLEEATRTDLGKDIAASYQETISIDPSRADAYIDLLDKVYLSDGNFTEAEATELRSILITPSGNSTYEEILATNVDGYALFAYRLGIAYYYNYEEDGNKQQSAYWFRKALTGSLDENQIERATRLGSIADYYLSLGVDDKSGDVSTTYSDYWNDLVAVCDGNITELDNATTALVIYKEMASQIYVNAIQFKKAGIEYSEIEAELEYIEDHVASDIKGTDAEDSERVTTLEEELTVNIKNARQAIELAYEGGN